jgi:hypothetical protein
MPKTAGYSPRPLRAKLGLKPSHRVLVINAPTDYETLLGEAIQPYATAPAAGEEWDFIHVFASRGSDLEEHFAKARDALDSHGLLWVSWPKQSSGVRTDLNENHVRAAGLALGLVDVKVAAIDEIWSGLKFVYRLQDRHP